MRKSAVPTLIDLRTMTGFCCAVAFVAFPTLIHAADHPNFVIIMADDLGYGDIGCFGSTTIRTPHLDELARRGLRLTDFHSSGAVCSPTRAGLMTGRYQQRAGIPGVISAANHRHLGLKPAEVTFAELLQEAGYATAIFGKWHLGYEPKYSPVRQGFDQFRGYVSGNVDYFSHVDQTGAFDWWQDEQLKDEEGYSTHLITRHAVQFIREHKNRPFCLYLPHEAPHYPYQGPYDQPERTVGGEFETAGKRTDIAAVYREMVEAMDEGVGQVVAALREAGIEDRTFVFFCSDNGATPRGSNGVLRGHKGSVWEGGHRVPAMATWPMRIAVGGESDQLTICLDVFPTLLSIAGLDAPANLALDGADLSGLLFDGKPLGERQLFWGHAKGRAMRDGPWKLAFGAVGTSKLPQLFDLSNDISESTDLSEKYPNRTASMTVAIKAWEQDVGPSDFPK